MKVERHPSTDLPAQNVGTVLLLFLGKANEAAKILMPEKSQLPQEVHILWDFASL
jgi:hypothetical protein